MASHSLNQYINIFREVDWKSLEGLIDRIQLNSRERIENVYKGDSRNELVKLDVVRFIIRKNNCSQIVNEPYCSEILAIFKYTNFLALIRQLTKINELQILRMQLNLMKKGSFVGLHTDQENNPAFLMTAILRTHSVFSNGELILHEKTARVINQLNRSVFLMDSTIEHEVLPVTQGFRNSFIILLGTENR